MRLLDSSLSSSDSDDGGVSVRLSPRPMSPRSVRGNPSPRLQHRAGSPRSMLPPMFNYDAGVQVRRSHRVASCCSVAPPRG